MRRRIRSRHPASGGAGAAGGALPPPRAGAAGVFHLDDLDEQIVRRLQENGRTPNAVISRELGVTETTIRKRIERLVSEGFIRITAVIDPRKTPYQVTAVIWMRIERNRAIEAAQKIAKFPNVVYVGHTTGPYDLLVEAVFESDDALFAFLTTKLTSGLGVLQSETYHVLNTVKINYDWRPPLGSAGPGGPSDRSTGARGRPPRAAGRVRTRPT